MHGLPFQDLLPGLLIVLVVDFDDVGHILCSEVVVTPAPAAAQTQTTVSQAEKANRVSVLRRHCHKIRVILYSLKLNVVCVDSTMWPYDLRAVMSLCFILHTAVVQPSLANLVFFVPLLCVNKLRSSKFFFLM